MHWFDDDEQELNSGLLVMASLKNDYDKLKARIDSGEVYGLPSNAHDTLEGYLELIREARRVYRIDEILARREMFNRRGDFNGMEE